MQADEQSRLLSFRCPIQGFLEVIKGIPSPIPEALPQRSNFGYRDADHASREINEKSYRQHKDDFVETHLKLSRDSTYPGLYFFFDANNRSRKFFYIGKADILFKRLTKHFLTFDYFFYASAFPHRFGQYYSDCLKFYADGMYAANRSLYERQFNAFRLAPFKEIGWISTPQFKDASLLKTVEDNAIFEYKPLANGTPGSTKGGEISANLFRAVKQILASWQAVSSH